MTKNTKIWVSDLQQDAYHLNSMTGFDTPVEAIPAMVETIHKYRDWQPIDRGELPEFLYFMKGVPNAKKTLPDACMIVDGFVLLSQKVADILQQFDLGSTQLHQMPIYENDKTTLHSSDHYILNVSETATCFVPERSSVVRWLGKKWSFTTLEKIAVLPYVICDVDLWADAELKGMLFVSDRLASALSAEKIQRFKLISPTVIQTH